MFYHEMFFLTQLLPLFILCVKLFRGKFITNAICTYNVQLYVIEIPAEGWRFASLQQAHCGKTDSLIQK